MCFKLNFLRWAFVIPANHIAMKFIKHALIGIALYEAAKYFLNKKHLGFSSIMEREQLDSGGRQQLSVEHIEAAGAKLTNKLTSQDPIDELKVGINPDAPLTGDDKLKDMDDPWKKSLANDELRAPDS